jgi:hypothetical protein
VSGLLAWRHATFVHRPALDVFQCTEKPIKSASTGWRPYHPRFWEHDAQQIIRGLEPPFSPPKHLLVGLDDVGLAAAVHWEELDGPSFVEVRVAGLALRCRRTGGGYADEMMVQALDAMTARALDVRVDSVTVTCYVYELNHPSQRMCRHAGLRHTGDGAQGVQMWSRDLPILGDVLA